MIVEEEVLESSTAVSAASRRQNRRRAVAMGLATLPIAGASVFAFRIGFGGSDSRVVPTTTVETTASDPDHHTTTRWSTARLSRT